MSDCTTMDGICHLLALSLFKSLHMSGSPRSQCRSYVIFPPYIGNGKMCITSISGISGISGMSGISRYIKEKGYLQW